MNLLNEKVKKLPSTPGVYLMKDSRGTVIYVGKSKNLKSRVQSYFYHSKAHSPKVEKLVKTLKDFDTIQTDTEFEAFMLECKLIKEIKPYFNRLMKNPHSYTYIVINMDQEIHEVEVCQSSRKSTKHLYFGPFTSKSTVEKAIQEFKDLYKINCTNHTKSNSHCLNYSLGLCNGMCLGGPAIDQHNTIIDKLASLLNGTDMNLIEEMKEGMITAADRFDFERAAKYRNAIKYLNSLINKERMIGFTEENHNIVMIEQLSEGFYKIFFIKRNKILCSETYSVKDENWEALLTRIKTKLVTFFQSPYSSTDLTRDEIDEAQIIYSYLRSNLCSYIIIPEMWLDSEGMIDNELFSLFSKIKDGI